MPIEQVYDRPILRHYDFDYAIRDIPSGEPGETNFLESKCILTARTYLDMLNGRPFARFTGGHEAGHAILHGPELVLRAIEERVKGVTLCRYRPEDVPSYKNPEWQADWFSGALLMRKLHIQSLLKDGCTIREIAKIFKVSEEAAKVRVDKVRKLAA